MRRLLAGLAALVFLTGMLGGCTSDGTDPDSGPEPEPTVPALEPPPVSGACYRITLAQATRSTTDAPAVACRRAHTTETIFVGKLPRRAGGKPVAVDAPRLQALFAKTCQAKLASFLGGTPEDRALSRFEVVWFSPSLEQYAVGADWFRCDVLAVAGPSKALVFPPRTRLRQVLDRPAALATYGLCGTAKPGTPGFTRVACTLKHSWVAVATQPIAEGRGGRYPGEAAARDAGDDRCADLVRSRNGFPLEFSYAWEWPTKEQWQSGQRYGFCWAPNELA